ncbi:LOW QUALITY PROTEIN: cubilin-like [Coccinella septempunctata]|uniref:LOW QUALITY PROTEIN: cubilin-like n=1 Tax=Coccinella septempunctata TaxID=41139 RepID=UPI001D09192B|nr:LOW QUALITY PROTEIN: cubilin-like [Coccinella septempunctata]
MVIYGLYLIFCLCSIQFNLIESAKDYAEILSIDGEITIRSAQDKNISFETDGQGDVYIKKASFANAASTIKRADEVMDDYKTVLASNVERLKVLHLIVEIVVKPDVNKLEDKLKNFKHSNSNPNLGDNLKAEIAELRSAVAKLKRLITKNECASGPCKNGGTCQDLFGHYHCSCPNGWEGLSCEKDVNECALFNSTDLGCQNGGICRNKPGSYDCICANGWHGLHCTTKKTDCFSGSAFEVCGHGTCIPQNNELGRKCICDQGWRKSNENEACVIDVDECKEENPVCSKDPLVSCENTPGSFHCGPCPAGYTGNGQYCTDINECELFNGGCSPGVECINTPGSRECGPCPPGYIGNGSACTYQGVCRRNNGNCHFLATCVEYPNIEYHECRCPPGYTGNGYGPRGCVPSTVTACSSNPCKFGTCTPDSNRIEGFRCKCQKNYYGKYCNHSLGLCSSNPCKNGGLCVDQNSTSYTCICPHSYIGKNCEISPQECGDLGMQEIGEISYPSSPSAYLMCVWNVRTEENKVFNITFVDFNIGNGVVCIDEWLKITEGSGDEVNFLGKFCGKELPRNGRLLSTKNKITISYRAKNRLSSFKLRWESVRPQCHEILNLTSKSTGSIKSPNWPNDYPENIDCLWLLQAPAGKSIRLTFFNFDLGNDSYCIGDFLEVSSSFTEGKDILIKKCGGPAPEEIISQTPEMRIHFHSDHKNSHRGFLINYSLQPGCGALLNNASGVIVPPRVAKEIVCFYQINHNLELKTKLTFNRLSLRESDGCTEEYVALYEGYNTSGSLIGRYCGNTVPSVYISDSGVISVKYKKTGSSSYFSLAYEAVCEKILETPSGYILSLGYPNALPVGLTCYYLIKQQPVSLITLHISLMDGDYLYYDNNCESRVFEIRDGDNENATLVDTPIDYEDDDGTSSFTVYSSSNSLWIKVNSSSTECASSFTATYSTTSDCGSLLRNMTGSITFSNTKRSKKYCRWILQAPSGFFIQLYVTLLDFFGSINSDCSANHVNLYENNSYSKEAKLIGSYCGKRIPPVILIPSNLATITVTSAGALRDQEFSANYIFLNESKVCGGNFFTSSGAIKSPQYPGPYPPSSDCIWTITVNTDQQIELKTSIFKMRVPCTMEYLEIRNGGSAFSPLIGRFCGTKIPKIIRSHTNQLYMHLVATSYSSIDRYKFMFTWETTTTGCGGKLTTATGALASPHYPEPYHSEADCHWSIIVSQGSTIQLVFLDFDLETTRFNRDFVEVFDGSSKIAKSLGRFSGSTLPQSMISTSRRIDIYFISDERNEGRGFNLHYRTICSNNLTGYGGVIESPNFPDSYPVLQECTWHIKVTKKNTVNITFSHFDLEEKGYHDYPFFALRPGVHINYLKIMYMRYSEDDLGVQEKVLLNTYVGSNLPDSVNVPSDHVILYFKSDTNLIGNGFRLEWMVNGCGGHLNKPGTITSPNYPKKYPDEVECEWLIEAPIGRSVVIDFTSVDIEKQNLCPYDVIKVFNGPDSSYPMLGSLCHMEKEVKFTSNGHLMHVSFLSDSTYAGKGFSADFEFIESKCGGVFSAQFGTITSPNFPKNFNVGDYCEYLISVDINHVIDLKFETLDLIVTKNCTKNSIKIYDGPSTMSPSLATICDSTNQTFTSTSNHMLVVFQHVQVHRNKTWRRWEDPDTQTSQGFKAVYSKACGSRIIASDMSGNLKLKPFSMSHSKIDSKCAWTIVAPKSDQRVVLTVTRLHMQSVDETSHTGLIVYGGESTESPLIGEYLTNKLPPTIVSGGSALHVVVKGDVDFFAVYHVYGASCGGILSGLNGMFSPVGGSCEWTIKVAPGNEISVSFKDFNIPKSDKCSLDYLEIRERNATGPLRGIFCGDKKPAELTHQGSLWFFFHSLKDNNTVISSPVGFVAEYATSTHVDVTGYRGEIASPLYPESFSSSVPFTWKISVPGTSRIMLEFEDFQTENFLDDYCLTPYLKVYDGSNDEATELGTFCGLKKPDRLESSSNSMFIEAVMDSSRLDNRFLLKWRRIYYQKQPEVNKTCGSEDIIDLRKIHKVNLTSPGYPNGYAPNLECEWNFETESGNSLRLKVNSVNLGFSSYCFHDYIRMRSDDMDKKICHRSQARTYNASRSLKVTFVTNAYYNGTGFSAEVMEGCGGVMKESSGVITFDSNSPRDWTCKWKINVKPGRRISIEFLKFTTSSSNRCDNFITLKNGFDSSSPNLGDGKFCEKPPKLKTTGNNLYIEFSGNPNNTEFKAVYREVLYDCGGSFALNEKLSSMQIMSPNHPSQSEPFIECVWSITSPPGTHLQVDFIGKFDFHQDYGCDVEGVELRDGGTNMSPLINKFCDTSPNTQFSTDNILFVKYFTQAKEPGDGFLANVSIASCGGTYKNPTGFIELSYLTGKQLINCTWNIIAPAYDTLDLNIIFKGLVSSYLCSSYGRFAVYEIIDKPGKTKERKNLWTDMCDAAQPKHITSVSNRVTIEFSNEMSSARPVQPLSLSITYNATGKECSYTLNTDFGELQSPNYPNLDYFKGYCVWTINAPKGRRVTVNITDFDLEKYSATSKDGQSIVFLDYGEYFMDEIFYNSSKRIYKSSGNVLQVIFLSEQSTTHRGFKAYYTSDEEEVCNQDFNAERGSLSRLPGDLTYVCLYKNVQKLPINRTLALTVNSTLNYKDSPRLALFRKSSISIKTEPYGEYTFAVTLLSSNRPILEPVIIRTAYLQTFLELQIKKSEGNFSIDYEYYPCGGLIQNSSGYISTYSLFKKRLECAWVIELPVVERIKLTFLSMNLGEDCEKSYIEVYNGKYSTAPRIGRYCNTNMPSLIVSQKSNLLIEYHHDGGSSGAGFNATYDTFTEGCGGTITSKYELIETPNYPKDYPNNAECRWVIASPEGSHMTLTSANRFHLEESIGCANDYVEIFDWKNGQWASLGKYCGRQFPQLTSSGNKMLIVFRSNDKISGSGFQVKWLMKCGGHFRATTEKKYITSPGYPKKYDNSLFCTYFIYGRDKIVVEFEDFALEGDYPTCLNDNVTVLSSSKAAVYCGQTKPSRIEARYNVFIKFRTDVWIADSGFKLSFRTDECGETITEPKTIVKPFSSLLSVRRHYYYRDSCLWNITAPKNKTIMMKFTNYSEVYSYMSCIGNALEVYDGAKFDNLLAKICGAENIQIPVITSTSNIAMLSLKTMDRGQISFAVEISFNPGPAEGCGGVYKLNGTKVIRPPKNFTNADCQWKFEVQEGYKVEFKIESLKLPIGCEEPRTHGSKNCTCSFIEIRDGAGPFSEEIDQFCSNTTYSQVYTTTWKFGFLRFYTATDYLEDTFRISVKPIKGIVVGYVRKIRRAIVKTRFQIYVDRGNTSPINVRILTSPGYPGPYESNIKCRWTINKWNFRQNIQIRFIEFDLTNSTQHENENFCSGDRIELDEGRVRQSLYEGRGKSISAKRTYNSYQLNKEETMQFCGKGLKPFTISTKNSALNIGFISTSDLGKGRGFKMEFSLSGCSSNFTQDSGTIYAAQENRTNCMIYLTSSDNTTLSLYFNMFWQGYRNNCSTAALEVYDGHSEQSTKLLRYCGSVTPNPVFGNSNKMLIILSGSQTYTMSSLEATFLASSNGRGCGGKIFDQHGTISSPFYPNNYTDEAICTWEINIPIGAQMKADVMNFRITGPCESNYLKVSTYENGKVNDRTFCGTDRIAQLQSANKMIITYKSSALNTGSGWLIKFRRATNRYGLTRNSYVPPLRPMPRDGDSHYPRFSVPFFSRTG